MADRSPDMNRPAIGLALGGGAARGWSHIGVLRELAALGVTPDVVCGTSIGALVGGLYVSGHLDPFEAWIRELDKADIVRYLDVKPLAGGGFVEGKRLIDFFRARFGDIAIEKLPKPFGAVATDLNSGQEVWLREGSLLDAIRASIALPGIFKPVKFRGRWLVDGGLVNPVPVSLCRALGAELVIAVNLNGDIVGKHRRGKPRAAQAGANSEESVLEKLSAELKQRASVLVSQLFPDQAGAPGMFDVLADSINIMQDRLTRSRMAGDPPDLILAPRLAHIGLLEFDRAQEAIVEGEACVRRMVPALQELLDRGA